MKFGMDIMPAEATPEVILLNFFYINNMDMVGL
jgi:hypothetical protein